MNVGRVRVGGQVKIGVCLGHSTVEAVGRGGYLPCWADRLGAGAELKIHERGAAGPRGPVHSDGRCTLRALPPKVHGRPEAGRPRVPPPPAVLPPAGAAGAAGGETTHLPPLP